MIKPRTPGIAISQGMIYLALGVLAILNLFPLYYMLINSGKSPEQFAQNDWVLPTVFQWSNYERAWAVVGQPMVNTLFMVGVSCVGILIIGSLCAYAFAILKFPGKNILYLLIFILLLIPSFLTLIPLYLQIKQINLQGFAAIIPVYIAGRLALTIFILRTFFEGISRELIEASRIDGAGEFTIFRRIAMPLSGPALVSVTVINFITLWNDYLLPQLLLDRQHAHVSVAITVFQGSAQSHSSPDFGPLMAAYVFMAIPIAVLLSVLMRRYIEGMTSGAIKA